MQPARLGQHVQSRPQVQVISVAQNNMRVDHLSEHILGHSLDRPLGAHRHEDGRLDRTVTGYKGASAGARMGIGSGDGE